MTGRRARWQAFLDSNPTPSLRILRYGGSTDWTVPDDAPTPADHPYVEGMPDHCALKIALNPKHWQPPVAWCGIKRENHPPEGKP